MSMAGAFTTATGGIALLLHRVRLPQYWRVCQRQLPQLTKRLNATLEKLRAPEVATQELSMGSRRWWADLERRLRGSGVLLRAAIETELDVPVALFDSEELSLALGRERVVHAVVAEGGIAQQLRRDLDRLQGMQAADSSRTEI